MAIVTRYHGDGEGVVNVDIGDHSITSNAKIISTGIGKHPTAFKLVGDGLFADSTTTPGIDQMTVGGAVETILRVFEVAGTPLAYQVDYANVSLATGQISLLVESTGWGSNVATQDANLQAAIQALGNRVASATPPVTAYNFANVVVTSTGGMKFA